MRAFIYSDRCIGCGICSSMCPAIFSIDEENLAYAFIGEIPRTYEDNVKEAKNACPASVIDIEL